MRSVKNLVNVLVDHSSGCVLLDTVFKLYLTITKQRNTLSILKILESHLFPVAIVFLLTFTLIGKRD